MPPAIAIVGMACRYPDADAPERLWENVLAQRRAFRPMPLERLALADYAPREGDPDTTYVRYAGVLENYAFDRVRHRIGAASFHAADICQWLALDVAQDALQNAGFTGDDIRRRDSTGVLVGNSLAGEFSRAGQMRLRWPYVRRQLDAVLDAEGWEPGRRKRLFASLEANYKRPFPAPDEESLAGGLSNTIAGRICNHFGLQGGGFTVDGACASSLLAVAQACSALLAGDLDMAIAGGVDLSMDPFELVGFARTGALAVDRMRVYDAQPTGFLPGEGCGFVVLMRHAEAVADGHRIHAVIRGWGVSSDGRGGLTRPEASGQQRAIARAYERADLDVASVPYFEGHGTGTAVGDAVELQALGTARQAANGRAAVIGSVKALIGHTKAASGVAGLIKATLAVKNALLPPTAGCERPHALLDGGSAPLRVLQRAEAWPDAPLLAGVNSMGFGGINVHVVIDGGVPAPALRRTLSARERRLDATAQDGELFVFDADNGADAAVRLRELATLAARLSQGELPDLAASLAQAIGHRRVRIALVASRPADLCDRLLDAATQLDRGDPLARVEHHDHLWIGTGDSRPRVGLLFPGQGSPARTSGGDWRRRFAEVDAVYRAASLPDGDETTTLVAQPGLVTASMATLRVLERLGIRADIAVGHSLGEISALAWAGAFSSEAAVRIAHARGAAMGALDGPRGGMASVGLSVDDVRGRLDGTGLDIAALNAPAQTVLSGEEAELESLLARLRDEQIATVRLPVSHAFHSRHVAAAEAPLQGALGDERIVPCERSVVSTVTGASIGTDIDLASLLSEQLTSPVRFLDALRNAESAGVDLWIEAGPGKTLSRLAALGGRAAAVSVDACGNGVLGLLGAVAAAFAVGARPDLDALFADRAIRPFDRRPRRFLANPCESAPEGAPLGLAPTADAQPDEAPVVAAVPPHVAPSTDAAAIADHLRGLLAHRSDLPASSIPLESRLLSDLHLNSLSAGQAIVETAQALGLPVPLSPLDFVDARISDIARVLATNAGGTVAAPLVPEGVGHWLRAFRIPWQARPLAPTAAQAAAASSWQAIGRPGPLLRELKQRLASHASGSGIAVLLEPTSRDDANDDLLVAAAQRLGDNRDSTFLLVQGTPGAAGFARSLHLERNAATVVVQVPLEHPDAVRWAVSELADARGFREARYVAAGLREEPVWQLVDLPEAPLPDDDAMASLPRPGEVLLVSGGGYGIAAECAAAIALRSGCALALLGRSSRGGHDELDRHLAHLDASGVTWRYYVADVTDADAVAAAVTQARHELGPITAVWHAAGINVPRLASRIDAGTLRETLAPKLDGLRHLVAALDGHPSPRLLLTFGSIIARIGLAGQAEYALANERLAAAVESLGARLPGCRCLNVEWSVWSGAGMGERLGSVDALARQGIAPIPSVDGVAMLQRLLCVSSLPVSIVACGRFGRPATMRFDNDEVPFLRFIERVRTHVPGVEIVVDADLSIDSDPYLAHHAYDGERLLPAVIGLEAMAQAAFALHGVPGSATSYRFDEVAFPRPVVVPAVGTTTLRIAALRRPSDVVDVVLRTSLTGFQIDHFRAACLLLEPTDHPDAEQRETDYAGVVALEPLADVYGPLLPHGAMFQRVGAYRRLSAEECVADIVPGKQDGWFRRDLPDRLLLGDPGMRDAAIHALQACVPHRTVLPVSVARLEIAPSPTGRRRLHARERLRDGKQLVYDLALHDADGRHTESWTGLGLRMVNDRPAPLQWSLALLGPYLERRTADLLPGPTLHLAMDRGVRGDARRLSEAMLQGRATITRDPHGRPLADSGYALSHAYTDGLMLAMAGRRALGCDLEAVAPRDAGLWRDLLGAERLRLAERIQDEWGEDLDTAATRVWTAMESIKKAGLPSAAPMTIAPRHDDGWLLLRSGSFAVASTVLSVRSATRDVAISLAAEMPA